MARMFGQEVDQALVESIEREEKLAAALFNESKKEPEITGYKTGTTFLNRIPILKEDSCFLKLRTVKIAFIPRKWILTRIFYFKVEDACFKSIMITIRIFGRLYPNYVIK